MKFGHHVVHSVVNVYTYKIAATYFEPRDSQFLGISLLYGYKIREFYSEMYNDEIMILYLLIAIYYCVSNSPWISAFFLSMSLSIKVGGLLLIPGYLGMIQYHYGPLKLAKIVAFLVTF